MSGYKGDTRAEIEHLAIQPVHPVVRRGFVGGRFARVVEFDGRFAAELYVIEPTGYAPSMFHAFPYATADAAWASLEAMAERRKAGSV